MKKRFGISIVLILILSLAIPAFGARLPTVNGDNDAWGTVLNEFLQVSHDSGGNILNNYITSSMIINQQIGALDLAFGIVNTTHIAAGGLTGPAIGSRELNGTHLSTSSALNVSNLILTGANQTGGITNGIANVTGIFFNKTVINLPSLSNQTCFTVPINMTGIPASVSCIPVGDPLLGLTTGSTNFTIFGTNSTVNNCRIIVCNIANQAVDLGALTYGAFGIATGLDGTAAGPAG